MWVYVSALSRKTLPAIAKLNDGCATTVGGTMTNPLADLPIQQRYIREIIFGKPHSVRYYQITKGSVDNPDQANSWFIMTNLPGDILLSVGSQ